jgi:hypothetical protein
MALGTRDLDSFDHGEGHMVASATLYCLADIVAEHLWAVDGFIPVEYYQDAFDEIPHFATRQEAEAVVRWRRKHYDSHLRVMVVRPGQRPKRCGHP